MDIVKIKIIKSTVKAVILFIIIVSFIILLGYNAINAFANVYSIINSSENNKLYQGIDSIIYQINIKNHR